jgi:protein gp37
MGGRVMKKRMFEFITVTWNPCGGECPHGCRYCYGQGENGIAKIYSMKKYEGSPRLVESELKKRFKDYDIVFVQDMGDLFADNVPSELITKVLENIRARKEAATYFFLTKNPARYNEFLPLLRKINCILGCTIETNREANYSYWSKAPKPRERWHAFRQLDFPHKFLSIEPVMAFDFDEFFEMILNIPGLEAVAVGYDNHDAMLPEPPLEKTKTLIQELKLRFRVYEKTLREAVAESHLRRAFT